MANNQKKSPKFIKKRKIMSKKCLKKYSRLAKPKKIKKIKIRRAKPVSHQEKKKQSNQEVHAQERKEKSGKLVCKSRTQKRKKKGG